MYYPTHRIRQRRIRHYIAKKKKGGVNTKAKKKLSIKDEFFHATTFRTQEIKKEQGGRC
jgi:hypothetical protein